MSLFLHLDMKAIICIGIFLFGAQNLISQQVTYKDSIDRVLEQYRKGNKVFNNNEKSTKRHYFFNKKLNQIVGIVIVNTTQHSGTNYYYLDTELLLMRIYLPYSAMPSSKGKPMSSAYYFKEGVLVEKVEINFPKVDIEKYKLEGMELYEQAVLHLKNKGINL
jgi:hypothetical protein